jgi:ribosomal protein S18 acetylase RimI-like enzyme
MIRVAVRDDAPEIAGLMLQLGYPTTAAAMAARLDRILPNPQFQTFVAVTDDRVSGMIGLCWTDSYEHDDLTGRIIALVVAEEARRRGVGRELLLAAEQYFAEHKVSRISLTTRIDREGAHRFYAAAGYSQTGYRFAKVL